MEASDGFEHALLPFGSLAYEASETTTSPTRYKIIMLAYHASNVGHRN